MTSSPAGSRATASTGRGWCRTSRRCSTTTASCSPSTRAGLSSTTTRTRPGSPVASPTSCSPSWAPTRAPSRPRWMRTPRARRAPSTSGRRPSWSTYSGPMTAPGPPTLLTVTERGTFEGGTSTLQLREQPDDRQRWESCRDRLLAARATRVRPERDDKVVAAWNGLAISGLVDAGTLLGIPSYVEAAVRCGEFLADHHVENGRLLRVSRGGVAGSHAGVLEDYGCVATGFLALACATGRRRVGGPRRCPARHGACALRRRGRRLPRHRRRRTRR